ncbi:hypothetical protein I4U23_030687 [Adineta vaga]|nr:hypothetical protein I4U23_030687 [Adineta vaga]
MTLIFVLAIIIFVLNLTLSNANNSTYSDEEDSIFRKFQCDTNNPADIWLNICNLNIDQFLFKADNFKAHVSLTTTVGNLFSFNVNTDVSVDKINLSTTDLNAGIQLAISLDTIAKIITRTLDSFDFNPFLTTIPNLLCIFTNHDQLIYQIIRRDGKIANQVLGSMGKILSSTIVGDYRQNMTLIGIPRILENEYTISQYQYRSPFKSFTLNNVLLIIIFDAFGNIFNIHVIDNVLRSFKTI